MTTTPKRTTVLITGANKGLGLESAHRLAALGWTVWLAARDERRGREAAATVAEAHPEADVRPLVLDVTDDASVGAARQAVESAGTGLDVLVNNAGIAGGYTASALDTTAEEVLAVHAVNVLGPVRVTHAFLPLLQASPQARLVMVSSGLGSLVHVTDPERAESGVPGFAYQSSKAALDMIASRYRAALPEVRVASVDPGYTATDLNGNSGYQTVTEGTDAIVAAASAETLPGWKFDRSHLAAA